jgi:hypothetical protein
LSRFLLLALRFVEVIWLVQPPFHPQAFHLHWLDGIAPVTLGAFARRVFFSYRGFPAIRTYSLEKHA